MSNPKIYITLQNFCEFDQTPLALLKAEGYEVIMNNFKRRLKQEEMVDVLKGVDGIIAGVEPYTESFFSASPKLKCISRVGIGTDSIDLISAKKHKVDIVVTVDEVVQPVAEDTVAMIMALAKNFPLHINDFRAGQWKKHYGKMIREWTIGLIGFGRIGRRVAELLKPFNPKILVSDPDLSKTDIPEGVQVVSQSVLLSSSDLVSIHATTSPDNGPLMGKKEFEQMKIGSFFVNTARGYLIDEEALTEALESHHLAGAALDVFKDEPSSAPLTKLPQVLCTPHVSTLTIGSRTAMEIKAAKNLISQLKLKAAV